MTTYISWFATRGANPWVWGKNLLFDNILAENCMKMKEIRPGVSLVAPWTHQSFLIVLLNSCCKLCEGISYLPVSGAGHFCHSTKWGGKHGDPFDIATVIITNINIISKFSHMFNLSFKTFRSLFSNQHWKRQFW